MKFTKMHGAGNDFVILNNLDGSIAESACPALARQLCAQHRSLGADGLMVVVPAQNGGDYRMLFYNADGSIGEMCGNGARCICRWGFENGLAGETQCVETTAGMVTGERISKRMYRIRLNDPSVIDLQRSVAIDGGQALVCSYIELGNPGLPHAIFLSDDISHDALDSKRTLCARLRYAPEFPKGANVSLCRLVGPDHVLAATYERGVEDFTLACGTGAGSITTALTLAGLVSGKDVRISMPGGDLLVTVSVHDGTADHLYLTGPTNLVAVGEITDEDLTI